MHGLVLSIPRLRTLGALEDVLLLEFLDKLVVQLQISRGWLLSRDGRSDAPLLGLWFCHVCDRVMLQSCERRTVARCTRSEVRRAGADRIAIGRAHVSEGTVANSVVLWY